MLVDATGIPLACQISAANKHDVTMLLPTLTAIPLRLLPHRKDDPLPEQILGDRAYDSQQHRQFLEWFDIVPTLAARNSEHGSGLGTQRYVVEQTIAAIRQNRRLKIRYEKRSDIHHAFLIVACIKVCWNRLLN